MKLIFENWKRFLKEEETKEFTETETKFFGNSKDLGKLVYDIYKKEIQKLVSSGVSPSTTISYHNDISDKIQRQIQSKTGKEIKDAGRGSFRATYIYDNDLVIKIDVSVDGSGKKMNQEDKEFGTRSDFDIFPRCYSWDSNYDWIILERVLEINNVASINSFFPNQVIGSSLIYKSLLILSMKYKVANFENNKQDAKKYYDLLEKDLDSFHKGTSAKDVIDEFNKLPLFNKVCAAIFTFKMDIDDSIRPFNTGIGSDDRFVILDSSVKKTIDVGLAAIHNSARSLAGATFR